MNTAIMLRTQSCDHSDDHMHLIPCILRPHYNLKVAAVIEMFLWTSPVSVRHMHDYLRRPSQNRRTKKFSACQWTLQSCWGPCSVITEMLLMQQVWLTLTSLTRKHVRYIWARGGKGQTNIYFQEYHPEAYRDSRDCLWWIMHPSWGLITITKLLCVIEMFLLTRFCYRR